MSALKNRLSTLPNEMILLIARTLGDANAARLKSVSSKLRRVPIYVPNVVAERRSILNENNGYNSNAPFNGRNTRHGKFQRRRDGTRVYYKNHMDLKAKKKAASMLSATQLPVKRWNPTYGRRNNFNMGPISSGMSYFGPSGYPYYKSRPIPAQRKYPLGKHKSQHKSQRSL